MVLNPLQLAAISQEYYTDGHVSGRDKLYQHMIDEYKLGFQWNGTVNEFDSSDDIAEWLKYQHVNTNPHETKENSNKRVLASVSIPLNIDRLD